MRRGFDAAWLGLWSVLSAWAILAASATWSATFDEPFYLKAGLERWRTGSHGPLMKAGTMPLAVDLQSFPVYLWERHRGTPFDPVADLPTILPTARAMNLVFWLLLLGGGWKLARRLGGVWGGRLALPVLALEPTLTAHAGLATTDTAVAAVFVWFVDHLLGREAGRGYWKLGGLYALLILAKASGLIFGPVALVIVGLHRAREEKMSHAKAQRSKEEKRENSISSSSFAPLRLCVRSSFSRFWRATRPLHRDLNRMLLIGLPLVFVYCGSDWKPEKSFVAWADKLPDGTLRETLRPVAQGLNIFPNAGDAIVYQVKHNMRGHGTFILGEDHPRAVWYYFPAALLMKLTLPALALVVFGFLAGRTWRGPAGAVALVMLAMSVNYRVQNGVRIVMPVHALILVVGAAGVGSWLAPRLSRAGRIAVLALVVGLSALPQWGRWGDGIAYFNRLWGGTPAGYTLMSDSNYDWGQGLLELDEWRRLNPERPLKVWYFGMDVRAKGFDLFQAHAIDLPADAPVAPLLHGARLAVSTTLAFGDPRLFTPFGKRLVERVRRTEPRDRTSTYLIFDPEQLSDP